MPVRRPAIALFATASLVAAIGVAAFSDKAASVGQEKARALAASASHPTVASVATATEQFSKPAPRDPVFAKYSDPVDGVSFRYPRNFALLELADDEDGDRVISWQQAKEAGAGVRTAEELNSEDPGATLLATIVVPDDAYPNTSFAGGSVQFAINRYQTAGTCRANLVARLGDAKAPSGTIAAHGITFGFIDIDAGDGNTEFYERDYAGFANDACYEFFVRIGVGSATLQNASTVRENADGTSGITGEESAGYRVPDERKILAHLEKIAVSLQVERRTVSALDEPKYKSIPAPLASN
ncbi:MAG TPA: hypothetical protein VMP12_00070 [Candidatus Sulfotelmatobacter sp.]|nr:hypothetical protein [Candidatus Sulfotelmatobacter sp.]